MQNILTRIGGFLEEGKKVALARIIRQQGSTPRTTGANCIIRDDGPLVGTIGGGRLEYEVATKAKNEFAAGRSIIHNFEFNGAEPAGTAKMICGGEVDVFTEYLSPDNPDTLLVFQKIGEFSHQGRGGLLLTRLVEGLADNISSHIFLGADGSRWGNIDDLSLKDREIERLSKTGNPQVLQIAGNEGLWFAELVAPADVLYIFGAGHVSACLAPLVKNIGFRLVVIDDRSEFCNADRFPDADELMAEPFTDVFGRINISPSSYLVIVTRGHVYDLMVLRSALEFNPAYIGMIGSARKIRTIYKALLEEGVTRERLNGVHAPIGLNIGAETPEEIAICITAELIQVRAGLKKQF